jgi:hypothetical protein
MQLLTWLAPLFLLPILVTECFMIQPPAHAMRTLWATPMTLPTRPMHLLSVTRLEHLQNIVELYKTPTGTNVLCSASGKGNSEKEKSGNFVSQFLDDITDYLDEKGGYIITGVHVYVYLECMGGCVCVIHTGVQKCSQAYLEQTKWLF